MLNESVHKGRFKLGIRSKLVVVVVVMDINEFSEGQRENPGKPLEENDE